RGVRRRRHERRQLVDPLLPADLLELAALVELVGDRDRVHRVAVLVELERRPVHPRVRLAVEVARVEDAARSFDRGFREHHRSQNRLFGVEILGRQRRSCLSGRDHHGLVNPAGREAATLWKGVPEAVCRRSFAGMTERMFADPADGVWTKSLAPSGNFQTKSTGGDGVCGGSLGRGLHRLWITDTRPGAVSAPPLWTKNRKIVNLRARSAG